MTDDDGAILAQLRAQTAWLRVLALPVLRVEIGRALNSTRKRAVYELTTGEMGVREIARATGASTGTVSSYWSEWEALGLVSQSGRRFVHIASLASIGLSVNEPDQKHARAGGEDGGR